jgi:hypothetical protein
MAKPALDPVVAKLDEILTVLQDLVIIEGEQAGPKLDTVRTILGTDRTRVSATWKRLKAARRDGQSA